MKLRALLVAVVALAVSLVALPRAEAATHCTGFQYAGNDAGATPPTWIDACLNTSGSTVTLAGTKVEFASGAALLPVSGPLLDGPVCEITTTIYQSNGTYHRSFPVEDASIAGCTTAALEGKYTQWTPGSTWMATAPCVSGNSYEAWVSVQFGTYDPLLGAGYPTDIIHIGPYSC